MPGANAERHLSARLPNGTGGSCRHQERSPSGTVTGADTRAYGRSRSRSASRPAEDEGGRGSQAEAVLVVVGRAASARSARGSVSVPSTREEYGVGRSGKCGPVRVGWPQKPSALCRCGTSARGEYAGVPCRYHGRSGGARLCATSTAESNTSHHGDTEARRTAGGRRRRKDGERHGGRPLSQRTQRTPTAPSWERQTAKSPSESGATSSEVLIKNGGRRNFGNG